MKNFWRAIILLGACIISVVYAAGNTVVALEKFHADLGDRASIERGAKFFAQSCMACHTMKYLKFNAIAKRAGIKIDKMPMGDKKWWLGTPPPDLSLIAEVHSPAWLYTFLHSFYEDSSHTTGTNNLLVPSIAMPNPFVGLQGTQVLAVDKEALRQGVARREPYYSVLKLESQGTMSAEQFDRTMADLVNFLTYASQPDRLERHRLGWWVLGFLFIFGILAFLLYRAYWRM